MRLHTPRAYDYGKMYSIRVDAARRIQILHSQRFLCTSFTADLYLRISPSLVLYSLFLHIHYTMFPWPFF